MAHTPTPWTTDDEDIYGADNKLIARLAYECNPGELLTEEDRANAAFIVRAVNSHDKLVEACKAALNCPALKLNELERADVEAVQLLRSALAAAEADNG